MGSLVPDKWMIRPYFIFVNNFLTIIVKNYSENVVVIMRADASY